MSSTGDINLAPWDARANKSNYQPEQRDRKVIVRPLGIPTSWNHFDIQTRIQSIYDAENVVLVSTYIIGKMLMGIFSGP